MDTKGKMCINNNNKQFEDNLLSIGWIIKWKHLIASLQMSCGWFNLWKNYHNFIPENIYFYSIHVAIALLFTLFI